MHNHPHLIVRLAAFVFVALLTAGGVFAETLTIQIDGGRSNVSFTLGATLHTVKGKIPVGGGTVTLNTANGSANGSVTAATSKANTGNESRDRDMHAKVLESASFPSAEFAFERIEGPIQRAGRSSVTVHGQMRVHGRSHAMKIPATMVIEGDRITADANFQVPYVQWGMKDPGKALLRVDKVVKVSVHLAGSAR